MESETPNLLEHLDAVEDKETFLNFVWALAKNREDSVEKEKANPSNPYGPAANGWENISIENFLEAAVACAVGRKDRMPEEASWKEFAEFLYGGKIYE